MKQDEIIERLRDDLEERGKEGRRIQEELAYSYSYPWDCDGYWITNPEEMLEWQFGDRTNLIRTKNVGKSKLYLFLEKLLTK